jgi:hypothetical protein
MTVTLGNRWARACVSADSANVTVDPTATKVRRNSQKELTDRGRGRTHRAALRAAMRRWEEHEGDEGHGDPALAVLTLAVFDASDSNACEYRAASASTGTSPLVSRGAGMARAA